MTTMPETIEFGEWLPDQPQSRNPGALIAKNVVPQLTSYRGFNSLSSFSTALANVCLGVFWTPDDNNVVHNYAGDTNALYELTGGNTWTDKSGPSAPYAASSWEFAKFGNRVLATAIEAPLQKIDMDTDPNFVDLAGSPPQARHIAVVRDFVMVGNLGTLGPHFIQWSGYNNSELWTPSLATQSDFQELFGRGGAVQRIVPGEYALIFAEQSIYRADYSGPPTIFQIDEIERKKGTPAPYSVVWLGGVVWYYGWDGFYVFDGVNSQPISENRVARWFSSAAAPDALEKMRGAVDRRNNLVMWAFSTTASTDYNDRILIYNWAADRWSYVEVDTEVIEEYVSSGFALDDLDSVLPGGIDTDSIPVDSDQYTGGSLSVQAFDTSHQSATFSGAPLTAQLDTKEISSPDGRRLVVNAVRPLIEATPVSTITVQVGSRDKLQDNVTFSLAKGQNSINGDVNLRANARYLRYRVNVAGGFTDGNGVKIQTRPSGGKR